jgi:hypothetical protein
MSGNPVKWSTTLDGDLRCFMRQNCDFTWEYDGNILEDITYLSWGGFHG